MDYFGVRLDKQAVNAQSILTLAHLGDSVYELMVRTRLCTAAGLTNRGMHSETLKYVSAEAQYNAWQKIRGAFTPEEEAVFLRGRNAHVRTLPKNADPAKYHAATGLEAVFGALWLLGERERLNQLFDMMIDT
jgi:ribonuclease-3 family protein